MFSSLYYTYIFHKASLLSRLWGGSHNIILLLLMGYVTFKCLFNLYWILWREKDCGEGGEFVLDNICCIEYIHVDVKWMCLVVLIDITL